MTREDLTLYCTASFRKYFDACGIGLPVRYLQQGPEDEEKIEDEVQVIHAFEFPERGGRNEDYLLMHVRCLVKTKQVSTDIYYHTRLKARVADKLSRYISVLKIGSVGLSKASVGQLRPLPSTTLMIEPAEVDNPNASVVETTFEFQSC
jgi:hypothetical protein